MAKLTTDDVQCIQFMPNGYVRVTFTSMEARSEALLSGIFYDSLRLRVFEAQPSVFNVYVHHLPFEVSDRTLEDVLCNYGVIHSVTEQTYPDSPIFNGTRIVKMTVTSPIPANLRVLRFPCRVFYKSQPMSCYICKKSHRAVECPLRDVCRRCRQPGHFAKDCTFDPVPAADPPAPAADPPAPAAGPPAPAAPSSVPAASPPALPVEPAAAGSDGSDVDPDYVPPADVDFSSASSSGEMSEDPASDDESPSVSPPQPSSADSVPSTPAPLPARVPRRRKYKPKIDVTTVHSRKSAKFSADPLPAVPAAPVSAVPAAPVDSAVQSSVGFTPEEPVSMFDPPVTGYHPPEVFGPEPILEEEKPLPFFARFTPHVAFFRGVYHPLDESADSFVCVQSIDLGPSTFDVLDDLTSLDEIRWAADISHGFSVFGSDCPPPVDLPPLPADVLPSSFPPRDASAVPAFC